MAERTTVAKAAGSDRLCSSNFAKIPQGPNKNSGRLETLARVTMQMVRQVRAQMMREFICKKKRRRLLMVPADCGSILVRFSPSTARLANSLAAAVALMVCK